MSISGREEGWVTISIDWTLECRVISTNNCSHSQRDHWSKYHILHKVPPRNARLFFIDLRSIIQCDDPTSQPGQTDLTVDHFHSDYCLLSTFASTRFRQVNYRPSYVQRALDKWKNINGFICAYEIATNQRSSSKEARLWSIGVVQTVVGIEITPHAKT